MAVDTAAHRLFVGGGKLVMMDAATGKVLASVPICGGTDAPPTTLDEARLRLVRRRQDRSRHMDASAARRRADAHTARGSRTLAVDPATHRVYTVTQDFAAANPASGGRGRVPVPDTLRVLVYGTR